MNIERPQGFEKEQRDCTVRALSLASNIPYENVHKVLSELGRKDGHGIVFKKVAYKVFNALNLNVRLIAHSGTVNKLIKKYPQGHILCLMRRHAFTVIDGVAHDLPSMNCRIERAWIIRGDSHE